MQKKPVSDKLESHVANLSKGAYAIPVDERTQRRINKHITPVLQKTYLRLLQIDPYAYIPLANYLDYSELDKYNKEPWRLLPAKLESTI